MRERQLEIVSPIIHPLLLRLCLKYKDHGVNKIRPSPKNPAEDGKFKGEQMMMRGGNNKKKSKNLQHVPGPNINQAKVRKLKGKQRQGLKEKDAKEGPHDRSPNNASARLVMNFLSPRQHHPHKGETRNYLKGHIIVHIPERAPTDRERQS